MGPASLPALKFRLDILEETGIWCFGAAFSSFRKSALVRGSAAVPRRPCACFSLLRAADGIFGNSFPAVNINTVDLALYQVTFPGINSNRNSRIL